MISLAVIVTSSQSTYQGLLTNIDVNNSNMSMFVNHHKLYVTRYSILDCLSTSCIAGRKRLFDIYHLWADQSD